jgi:hypothetical protein
MDLSQARIWALSYDLLNCPLSGHSDVAEDPFVIDMVRACAECTVMKCVGDDRNWTTS